MDEKYMSLLYATFEYHRYDPIHYCRKKLVDGNKKSEIERNHQSREKCVENTFACSKAFLVIWLDSQKGLILERNGCEVCAFYVLSNITYVPNNPVKLFSQYKKNILTLRVYQFLLYIFLKLD